MKKLYDSKILNHNGIKLDHNRVLLDTSETGSGKTFTSCSLAKQLNLGIFVVCPKSVIEDWYEVASLFEVDIVGITNYEVIKSQMLNEGYVNYFDMSDGWNTIPSQYQQYIYKRNDNFEWNLVDTLIIFDEGHKSKNEETINAKLLLGAKKLVDEEISCKLLILTATPLEKSKQMNWLVKILGYNNIQVRDIDGVHEILYESQVRRAVRMTIPPIKFKNKIEAHLIKVKDSDEIEQKYLMMRRRKSLGDIILLRKEIEIVKVKSLIPYVIDDMRDGNKIVIFVNFLDSIDVIARELISENIKYSVIFGDQNIDERSEEKMNFLEGDSDIIISTISAGGTGISLHDTIGNSPRISYIMPPESATILKQALGRIYRFGLMSPVIQKIIFVEGEPESVEMCLHSRLKDKIEYIDKLVTGDYEDILRLCHDGLFDTNITS